MDNENFKSTAKSAAASTSVQPKDAVPRRRMNTQMMQNFLLIWLDKNIDEKNADCRNTMTQLRRAVNSINTYTDGKQCVEFLEKMVEEKACMVISGSLGEDVVPRVHNMSQVDSIFIFCSNKKYHEGWTKEWPKVKGVFTEIGSICEALKKAAQQCEQDSMAISFVATSGDTSKKNLDQLPPSFMYTQILKEILLSITFEQQHINEFVQYCREALTENEDELKNVKKFERQYREQTTIWWYTFECFLYPMVNRTLRLLEADMIVTMGFFIVDLHRQIEQLHQEQFGDHHSGARFIVYRGQGLSKADFEQMSQNKGGLICFNNFLSTSKDGNVSLCFAHGAIANPEMMGVLFIMTIDPTQSSTPFASITDVGYFKKTEDEVLFSMHTVFRIDEITPMDGNNRLFQVKLTLTSDNDTDLRVLTDRIREETYPTDKGWYRLGQVLLNTGQSEKAQQVYEILLGQTTIEFDRGRLYGRLGMAHYNKGDYQEAIGFYEKSQEMYNTIRPPPSSNLAASYNNIGMVYNSTGDYPKALSSHEKALAIKQQSLPPNHPDLAASYTNIGSVYTSMGDYPKALSSHEKALAIKQQSLLPNHPDLAYSYNNIGNVYNKMSDYPKVLSSYEKALAIRQQSLPPNHPDLAMSYGNIGNVYSKMGKHSKALPFCQLAADIAQRSLSSNHPHLQWYKNNLEVVKKKL